MLRKRKKLLLKCFEEESRQQNLLYRVDRGIKMVQINKITGSVGRCVDFDVNFEPQGEHIQERLNSAKFALESGINLPPVELYKIRDEYYVVDGHHRIAAARKLGKKYLEAHVIEYLPPQDSLKNILYHTKLDFEYETGLEGLNLSKPDGYEEILSQIKNHYHYLKKDEDEKITFKEAASHWFHNIYQPLIKRIEKEKITHHFRNVTAGDIYLYISTQLQLRNRKKGHYISLSQALREVNLLGEETRLLISKEDLKEKIKRIIFPCYYLRVCPYLQPLRRKRLASLLRRIF